MYSQANLAHIDEIEKMFHEHFPADCCKKYTSAAELHDQMQTFGSTYGVAVTRCGHKIECFRADREKNKKKPLAAGSKPIKTRNRTTQRCGCMFSCNFAGDTKTNKEVDIQRIHI